MTTEADSGVMWPRRRHASSPPGAGRGEEETLPWSPRRECGLTDTSVCPRPRDAVGGDGRGSPSELTQCLGRPGKDALQQAGSWHLAVQVWARYPSLPGSQEGPCDPVLSLEWELQEQYSCALTRKLLARTASSPSSSSSGLGCHGACPPTRGHLEGRSHSCEKPTHLGGGAGEQSCLEA